MKHRLEQHTSKLYTIAMFMIFLVTTIPFVSAQNAQQTAAVQNTANDTEPPEITYFTIYPATTAASAVEFEYEAQDFGAKGESTQCSGIQKVEFYDAQTKQTITTANAEKNDCIVEDKLAYTPTRAGKQTICAVAQDYTGKRSTPKCAELNSVQQAPEPQKTEFSIKGAPTEFASKDGTTVDLKLLFEDASIIDIDATKVNVEKITGVPNDWRDALKTDQNTVTVPSITTAKNFECKITLDITDNFGNNAKKEIQCELKIDTDAPTPTSLDSELQDTDGFNLVSTQGKTKIIATINEKGIGFAQNKKVYLDLSQINNNANAQADKCEKNTKTDLWQCEWQVKATAKKGVHTIKILSDSEDDFGNKFTKDLKQDVDVTDTTLSILDVQYAPEFPTEQDELTIITSVPAQASKPIVTVDASEITANKAKKNAECELDASATRCTATFTNLLASAGEKQVTITVQDSKGNKQQTAKKIQIFEAETKTKDYFSFGGATIRPTRGIDRKTATITQYPVFVTINWLAKETDLEIATQTINCDEKYLATAPEINGKDTKRPTIFFRTTTDVSDVKEDSIKIKCTADLTIKKGKALYKKPETKEFTLTVPLYNTPLGTVGENIERTINQTTEQIKALGKKIDDVESTNRALGKSYGLLLFFLQMLTFFINLAVMVVATLIKLLDVLPKDFVEKTWNRMCTPTMKATRVILILASGGTLYSFMGMDSWLTSSIWMSAMIYSCKLCPTTKLSSDLLLTGEVATKLVGQYTPATLESAGAATQTKTLRPVGETLADENTINVAKIASVGSGAYLALQEQKGKPTQIQAAIDYEWEPKKSLPVAQNCFCLNGIEYNLRKEQQIMCIYKKCVKEHAKKGLPITNCGRALTEQNCMYVESAAWKLAGGKQTTEAITSAVTNIIGLQPLNSGPEHACTPTSPPSLDDLCKGSVNNAQQMNQCGITNALSILQEMNFFAEKKQMWDLYNAELEGKDNCATEE